MLSNFRRLSETSVDKIVLRGKRRDFRRIEKGGFLGGLQDRKTVVTLLVILTVSFISQTSFANRLGGLGRFAEEKSLGRFGGMGEKGFGEKLFNLDDVSLQGQMALDQNPALQQILRDKSHELKFTHSHLGNGLKTARFQHYYKGLEVLGSEVAFHKGATQEVLTPDIQGFALSTEPKLTAEQALSAALAKVTGNRKVLKKPELKIFPPGYYDASPRLVYWVRVGSADLDGKLSIDNTGFDFSIDAQTGEVLSQIPHRIHVMQTNAAAAIHVVSAANAKPWDVGRDGSPLAIDLDSYIPLVVDGKANKDADESSLRALENSKTLLNYYNELGRNSLDGNGLRLLSIVHIGKKWSNAFWDSQLKVMAYGDGDGKVLRDFTHGVDVAGHEMTHGVVSFSVRTADGEESGLLHEREPGALNEALADFFGEMVENDDDWVIGDDLFEHPDLATKGIRNLKNPRAFQYPYFDVDGTTKTKPYPAHFSERYGLANGACSEENDRCGVHVNSTIVSHSTYLISQALGKPATQKLMYAVMSQMLTPTSNFTDFAKQVRRACGLLSYSARDCESVETSLKTVGI